MGAIVIGIGAALAALGVVLGAIGLGSMETTSGAALMTLAGTGFVGGLLMVALGFILRVLGDIAEKLEGAVHFEPYEDEVPAGRVEAAAVAVESGTFVATYPDELEVPPARAPQEMPKEAPVAVEEGSQPPSWFRRKRSAEPPPSAEPAFDAEPEFEPEAAFEPLPPFRPSVAEPVRPEPPRVEPVRGEAPRPEIPRAEPPRRELPPFLRTGTGVGAPVERVGAGAMEEDFEPRPPRAREDFAVEADEATPAFLSEADLLAEAPEPAPPAAPSVTVLKSGTIGGMTYKLYSDGSIEADLPDGTLRFASLQELRDHVAGGMVRD